MTRVKLTVHDPKTKARPSLMMEIPSHKLNTGVVSHFVEAIREAVEIGVHDLASGLVNKSAHGASTLMDAIHEKRRTLGIDGLLIQSQHSR